MNATRSFDLVIFDLDGTLVDSLPDIAWALNTTLSGAHLPTLPQQTETQFVGDGAAKLIERAVLASGPGADASPGALDRLFANFLSHYASRPCAESRLYPGVTALLRGLEDA